MGPQPAHTSASHVGDRNTEHTDDADLLDRVRVGDIAAYQELVDRYWHPLLGFAARILDSEDAAEDVVQRAFIRLWERRDRWRAGSRARLILYTVARNLALNQLESERAQRRRSADHRVSKVAWTPTPAQMLDARELRRALEHLVAELPPRRREALVLARFHHMTHAEIAEVMGISERTVTNHISTALSELEAGLKDYLAE